MRALLSVTVDDQAGNVLEGALVNVYEQGTVDPETGLGGTAVSDLFAGSSGGSAVGSLTSDAHGLVVGWLTAPRYVDVVVSDNGSTAFLPAVPSAPKSWSPYTLTVRADPDPALVVVTSDSRLSDARTPSGAAGGVLGGTYPNPSFAADMATQAELDAAAALLIPLTQRAAANGVATLDGSTKVPVAQLPTGSTSSTVTVGNDSRLSDARTPSAGSVVDASVSSSAAIAESKLALASDAAPGTASRRTLGTGATQAFPGTGRLDQLAAPTADVALNGHKLTGLANPTLAQDAMTKATADASYAPLDRGVGTALLAIGDSITANGVSVSSGLAIPKNYLLWAVLQSQGQFAYAGVSGTSGFTTAQVLATHVPVAVAAKPAACVVLCGINDVTTSVAAATSVANLTTIYQTLWRAGILPVLCTLTPLSSASDANRKGIAVLNNWIKRYGAEHAFPVVDLYAACVNTATGDWAAVGDNADSTHPAGPGAKKMGKAIADTLTGWMSPGALPLVQSQATAAQQASLLPNGLLLTDTNADGIPDNWAKSGTGTGSGALSDATGDGLVGNWFVVTHSAADAFEVKSDSLQPIAAGDKVGFGLAFKWTVTNATARVHVRLTDGATGLVLVGGFENFDLNIPLATFWQEVIVPNGVTSVCLHVTFDTEQGVAQIAQPTIVNLTNLAIASVA